MGETLRRIKTHRKAKEIVSGFYDNNSHVLIIHYSCESFYDIKEGRTPRITSIAVRFLSSAQTKSFSIYKIAEIKKLSISEVGELYDVLEKEMLKDFYDFVKSYKNYKWVHWNMRDINYGFEALKHRATILGVKPVEIKDEDKYDLARILIGKYGKEYSSHPRLPSIMEMNKISSKHWLNGSEEAKAFEEKAYVKLHQSTLAKVDVIENILKLSAQERLKTKSSLTNMYGLSAQGLYELTKDHWLYSVVIMIVSAVIGFVLSKLFE